MPSQGNRGGGPGYGVSKLFFDEGERRGRGVVDLYARNYFHVVEGTCGRDSVEGIVVGGVDADGVEAVGMDGG